MLVVRFSWVYLFPSRPAAAFGIAGAGGVSVVTAAGVVSDVAAAVVFFARVAHPIECRGRFRKRGVGA